MMQVYGDRVRECSAVDHLAGLRIDMQRTAHLPPGLMRHSALIGLLVEAGMLAQGLADMAAADSRGDLLQGSADAAMELSMAIARCCAASWSSGFASRGELPITHLARCETLAPTASLSITLPEGYAFYAVYPEGYLEAALACRRESSQWQVVGLRSIGTSLAAITAVGLGAPLPRTVRPSGHPFDRQVVAPRLAGIDRHTAFAVVDEGPGLSGSSMAAAARWLQHSGAPLNRVHFFPSHEGVPGPRANASTRAVWAAVARQHVSFDHAVGSAVEEQHRLQTWVESLAGPLIAPLQDIGNGAWRELKRSAQRAALPPSHPWQERRKYLARTRDGSWLVKFAGLGRIGEQALTRARILADAGFTPAPLGLCHGFLVERWHDELGALTLPETMDARIRIVLKVADYLGFRAKHLPAQPRSGASVEVLSKMTSRNTGEALGPDAQARYEAWASALQTAGAAIVRVQTDNRMHRWEWIAGPMALLKTDAVDHAFGHDLVGCQDIAWDVVGAEIELALTPGESALLVERIRSSGSTVVAALVSALRPCYCAFHWAHFTMAAEVAAGSACDQLHLEAEGYRRRLARLLGV